MRWLNLESSLFNHITLQILSVIALNLASTLLLKTTDCLLLRHKIKFLRHKVISVSRGLHPNICKSFEVVKMHSYVVRRN